jgi:hypothetical protein
MLGLMGIAKWLYFFLHIFLVTYKTLKVFFIYFMKLFSKHVYLWQIFIKSHFRSTIKYVQELKHEWGGHKNISDFFEKCCFTFFVSNLTCIRAKALEFIHSRWNGEWNGNTFTGFRRLRVIKSCYLTKDMPIVPTHHNRTNCSKKTWTLILLVSHASAGIQIKENLPQ